jgi:hypothetical protein
MVLSPQFLKKKFGNTKKTHTFAPVGVTTIINTLKTITIMQKFIISVKDKNTGRDVIPPYIVNSLEVTSSLQADENLGNKVRIYDRGGVDRTLTPLKL